VQLEIFWFFLFCDGFNNNLMTASDLSDFLTATVGHQQDKIVHITAPLFLV
jgi:hypothetical protein